MPADEYAAVGGGGALKLKGAKVQKSSKKKKKNKDKAAKDKSAELEQALAGKKASDEDKPEPPPTTAAAAADDDDDAMEHKTEAERRHAEFTRKKLLKMLEDPTTASELRKTHKERVEGLNTYLSKLSEHHDMPKIGPG
ncbi:hypothetical protein F4780DRAFT_775787 [Xylariomycetidae sp. FL0641]|nr:hypothetical protein F4780DRAFT_775787 [Xylariomycetidae sp. FL0641]